MLQVCFFSTVITLYKNMYWTRLSKTHLGFLFFHGHMPKEEVCCSAVQKKRRVQIDSMCVQGKDKYLQALGFLAQLPRFLLGTPYLFTMGYSHLTVITIMGLDLGILFLGGFVQSIMAVQNFIRQRKNKIIIIIIRENLCTQPLC